MTMHVPAKTMFPCSQVAAPHQVLCSPPFSCLLFSLHGVLLLLLSCFLRASFLPSTAATIHGRLLDLALLQKKSQRSCEYWRVDTTAIDEKLPICVKDICVSVWEREREREFCLLLQLERRFCMHACVHWWKKRCGCQPRCGITHLVVSSILLHSLFSFSCNIAAFLASNFVSWPGVSFFGGASASVIALRNISTMIEIHWARKSVVQIVDGTFDAFSFVFFGLLV